VRRLTRAQAGGILVIMAAAVISGTSSADEPAPRRYEVAVEGLEFSPSRLSVRPGDTVVWVNRDAVPHTVSPESGAWDSGELAARASCDWVAQDPGTVEYACRYHPLMEGVVEVVEP